MDVQGLKADFGRAVNTAVEGDKDLNFSFPCGTTIFVPATTLKQWKETPATGDLVMAMAPILAAGGSPAFQAGGTIMDLLLALLNNPAVMQLLLTLLSGSITP